MPTYDEMPEKCMNCYFFEWLSDDEGVCNRYPPQHIFKGRDGRNADDWRLPVVYGDVGWCGEFKFDPSRTNDRGGK